MIENISFDLSLFEKTGVKYLIGLDEAGRGPLAGPLYVGIVVFTRDMLDFSEKIDDSKKLSEKKRILFFDFIKKNAYYWNYKEISPKEIDEKNIYQATLYGMNGLVSELPKDIFEYGYIISDAMKLDLPEDKFSPIIKGDAKSYTIAAASIVAKVLRDEKMKEYAKIYPEYGFERHKGYPTKAHIEALQKFGPTKIHRFSYKPVRNLVE